MTFASKTSVPIEKTEAEIKALLRKAGAVNAVTVEPEGKHMILCLFECNDRRYRFSVPLPKPSEDDFWKHPRYAWKKRSAQEAHKLWEQACRRQWRCLLLAIRSKFVNAEAGIESLELGLLPYVVMPDGRTLAENALPIVDEAYRLGKVPDWKALPEGA